ncbi:MAG: cytochrome ubiquinol oxidase subunit I, partial [Gemmatimonadetes bacterium]|nr:cytochrome ubiquinol oxidase subunit I [Gemmatimonadota bacterium]
MTPPREGALEQGLEAVWGRAGGALGWLSPVNHRVVGKRYLVTAFVFFLLAGIQALLIRVQLARPENTFLDPATYNQLF